MIIFLIRSILQTTSFKELGNPEVMFFKKRHVIFFSGERDVSFMGFSKKAIQ